MSNNNSPGRPTIATRVGVFFQLGFKLSLYGEDVEVFDFSEPAGEFKFGYKIIFQLSIHGLSLNILIKWCLIIRLIIIIAKPIWYSLCAVKFYLVFKMLLAPWNKSLINRNWSDRINECVVNCRLNSAFSDVQFLIKTGFKLLFSIRAN